MLRAVFLFVASRNFLKWQFRRACCSVSFVCVCACVRLSVRSSKAIFIKLNTGIAPVRERTGYILNSSASSGCGARTFWRILRHCETRHFATILLISVDKKWKDLRWNFTTNVQYLWTRTSSSNFGTRPESGSTTHSYFCLMCCPIDLDRVSDMYRKKSCATMNWT